MSKIHRTADQDTLRTVLEMCAELKVKNERLRKEVLVSAEYLDNTLMPTAIGLAKNLRAALEQTK